MIKLLEETLIDPDLETHFHYHRKLNYWTIAHDHDFYEIFLITDGSVCHIANGHRKVLREGALVFVRPEDCHSYERHEGKEVGLLNINFRRSLMDRAFGYLGEEFGADRLTTPALPPSRTVSPLDTAWFMRQFERIQTADAEHADEIRLSARGFLVEVLFRYFGPAAPSRHPEAPAWLNDLLDGMRQRDNFAEGIAAFYRLAPYSVEHVCREMKKHLGMTPTEWVNDQRVAHAAYLLRHSESDILDISMDCGFSSLSYFYKIFALHYAATPAQYRRKHLRTAIP